MMRTLYGPTAVLTFVLGIITPFAAAASEKSLAVELNALDALSTSCRVTFVASNKTDAALQGLGYEVVLFGKDGGIERMTKFDFGALPVGKTVVRRFDFADTACANIGRVLINGSSRCEASDDLDCDARLVPTNRTAVEFGK